MLNRTAFIIVWILLAGCWNYKKLPVNDKEVRSPSASAGFVEFEGKGRYFKPVRPYPGVSMPHLVVSKYKRDKQDKSKLIIVGYVSYRIPTGTTFVGSSQTVVHYFPFTSGYSVSLCCLKNGRLVETKEVAKDREWFRLHIDKNSKQYLVLFIESQAIGRVYKVSDIYYDERFQDATNGDYLRQIFNK